MIINLHWTPMSSSRSMKFSKCLPRVSCNIKPEDHAWLFSIRINVHVGPSNYNEAVTMADNTMTWQQSWHIRTWGPFARVWAVDLHTGNTCSWIWQGNSSCHVEFTQKTNTSSLCNNRLYCGLYNCDFTWCLGSCMSSMLSHCLVLRLNISQVAFGA